MKKLDLPAVDDNAVLTALANNHRLTGTTYPHLRNKLTDVLTCYQLYIDELGDALNITPLAISANLEAGLKKNYKSPPKELDFIDHIRKRAQLVCPMCGSFKPFSIDHILPKEDYPEFSVFSKNLVPACDCNSQRGTATKDVALGARVLHPYFDTCLRQRQLSCSIVPAPAFPKAKLKVSYVNNGHVLINSLRFHVSKVVIPSGIMKWLDTQWGTLTELPAAVIQTLPHEEIASEQKLVDYLKDSLNRYDISSGTPNNWNSIFIHGLLESPGVVPWIFVNHNQQYD
ncbi:MAG: HNH endonuclease [Candidatus Thiodiazotropha lotti]|nr:HNH endonuclease [Candidatus Thiodiazotropha lotti]MCW4194429.1 HNH endonuclease [Candidatus Thiodiazotropha lotti]